jgi:hypothetical protein
MSALMRTIGFSLAMATLTLCAAAFAGSDTSAPSQSPPADDGPRTPADPTVVPAGGATSDQIELLIRQLGDPSFAVRQRATRQLMELGVAARDALAQAADDADAEVRVRARSVLGAVADADFRARLEAFSSDYDGSRKRSLPGWEQFASQFGGGRVARQAFVEMQRAEPQLLEAFAKGNKAVNEAVQLRCQTLSQQAMQNPREALLPIGTIASMLLVGSSEGVVIDEQVGSQLFTWMLYQQAFQKNAASGPWAPMLKKLLGRWVIKDTNATATVQNLMFAASYELKPEALQLATRVLGNENNHSNVRQYAILIVGRFGGKEHLTLIDKLLHDTTSCGTFHMGNPPQQVDLQIRDIALAVAVHLSGQSLRDYNFLLAQPNPTTLFQVNTLVFQDPAKRDEALKKWAVWRSAHPES